LEGEKHVSKRNYKQLEEKRGKLESAWEPGYKKARNGAPPESLRTVSKNNRDSDACMGGGGGGGKKVVGMSPGYRKEASRLRVGSRSQRRKTKYK